MPNPAHVEADTNTVRDYLLAAYVVNEGSVSKALAVPAAVEVIEDARRFRSHAYYAGDKIAAWNEWAERPDFNIDEDDEDDEDDDG